MGIDVRGRSPLVHHHRRPGQVVQLPTGGAVVGMGMGIDNSVERAAVISQCGQVTIDLVLDGID